MKSDKSNIVINDIMAFYEDESYLFGSDEVFTVPQFYNITNFYNDIYYNDIIYNIRCKVDTKQHELWRYHMQQYHKKLFNKKYNKTNPQTFFSKQFSKKII